MLDNNRKFIVNCLQLQNNIIMGQDKKTGRPHSKVNWTIVDRLLRAGCNGVQVAAKLGIHYDTLVNHLAKDKPTYSTFSAYMQEKRSGGDADLLEAMYNNALDGDKSLQIWLSKNRLGYAEKQEIKSDNTTKVKAEIDYSKLSIDELKALQSISNKLGDDKTGTS